MDWCRPGVGLLVVQGCLECRFRVVLGSELFQICSVFESLGPAAFVSGVLRGLWVGEFPGFKFFQVFWVWEVQIL